MVVFPWSAIVSACIVARHRRNSEEEEERKRVKIEEQTQIKPQNFKVIENYHQIEIFPYYAYKMEECYSEGEDGQINILKKVYRPKEIIARYEIEIDYHKKINIEDFLKKTIDK